MLMQSFQIPAVTSPTTGTKTNTTSTTLGSQQASAYEAMQSELDAIAAGIKALLNR